jgi:hypothetical protein
MHTVPLMTAAAIPQKRLHHHRYYAYCSIHDFINIMHTTAKAHLGTIRPRADYVTASIQCAPHPHDALDLGANSLIACFEHLVYA